MFGNKDARLLIAEWGVELVNRAMIVVFNHNVFLMAYATFSKQWQCLKRSLGSLLMLK
jgi:hypothetical protein